MVGESSGKSGLVVWCAGVLPASLNMPARLWVDIHKALGEHVVYPSGYREES